MIVNENVIVKLSFEFALEIIKLAEILEEDKKYVIARQILKSGTSVGANILTKAKMLKAKLILFINSKLPQKKQVRQHIGYYFVSIQKNIRIQLC